ncbi:hypothetical protein AJ80_01904 [Polytolypa hystricis UAMH7299]|uniref:Uncharacterized protein n=1 Tax=Polytolypa hystricis (strain UAMH7299) TaxID=1447883 RepID=A0A2B7YXM4_POLH7|nr:hypothetical protein AJ80_01904 [Polytolypa hystricis UAMH7299]
MGLFGDLSPQGSIALGVLVGLVSTSLQAIGLTLQRKSHLLEEEKYHYELRRPAYKRRRWQVGMFMFVISNIVGSTIQITTLPLPVLSTLQASGLVFNTIFAALILGEPFTRYSILGTILVCAGAVMIATFGAISEPAHTLDQLLVLLARRPFLLWMIGTTIIVILLILGTRILKIVGTPLKSRDRVSRHSISHIHSPRIKVLRGILFGAVSGILSAHSLLVAKSAVELLVRTIVDGVNQFNRWQSWAILLGLVALALTQLYYLHLGLKLCSTSILYPFVFCIYNIIAILDGLVYFHQASRLSALSAGLIAIGTVILLSGVLCLSWRLEDVTGRPAVMPVAPTTTPLTPGMGLLNEQVVPPTYSDFMYPPDEESQPGERQPLLYTPQPARARAHRHTISLPRVSPKVRRSTDTGTETEQIWAELADDSETLPNDPDILSALPQSSPLTPRFHHRRHRSKSSAFSSASNSKRRYSGSRGDENERSPASPLSSRFRLGTWDNNRRIRFSPRDTRRRTSAPIISHPRSPYQRFRDVSADTSTGALRGEGDGEETPTPDRASQSTDNIWPGRLDGRHHQRPPSRGDIDGPGPGPYGYSSRVLANSNPRRSQSRSPSLTPTIGGPTPSPDSEWKAGLAKIRREVEGWYHDLIRRGGRPAFPLELSRGPPSNRGEYTDIMEYLGQIRFRKFQRRNRKTAELFAQYQQELSDYRRNEGIEGDLQLLFDAEQQSKVDEWREYYYFEHLKLARLRAKVEEGRQEREERKRQWEAGNGVPDMPAEVYDIRSMEERGRDNFMLLLKWIEEELSKFAQECAMSKDKAREDTPNPLDSAKVSGRDSMLEDIGSTTSSARKRAKSDRRSRSRNKKSTRLAAGQVDAPSETRPLRRSQRLIELAEKRKLQRRVIEEEEARRAIAKSKPRRQPKDKKAKARKTTPQARPQGSRKS